MSEQKNDVAVTRFVVPNVDEYYEGWSFAGVVTGKSVRLVDDPDSRYHRQREVIVEQELVILTKNTDQKLNDLIEERDRASDRASNSSDWAWQIQDAWNDAQGQWRELEDQNIDLQRQLNEVSQELSATIASQSDVNKERRAELKQAKEANGELRKELKQAQEQLARFRDELGRKQYDAILQGG